MIAIIDYGVGNISAFINIYKSLGTPLIRATKPADLENVSKLILPGVGHFDFAMRSFNDSGMREKVDDLVLNQQLPIIGICVGMQMMANSSDEGSEQGLGWIDAEVLKLKHEMHDSNLPLPHMGWNDVHSSKNALFTELDEKSKFYFLHSYYFSCNDTADSIASAKYSFEFACAINRNNMYGVQFHPEKSHRFGIQLLKNFAELC